MELNKFEKLYLSDLWMKWFENNALNEFDRIEAGNSKDMYQKYTKEQLKVTIECPGVEKEDIKIDFYPDEDCLLIETKKQTNHLPINKYYSLCNKTCWKYDFSKTTWSYKNGIIYFIIPAKKSSIQNIAASS